MTGETVVVVGSGGREHVLGLALGESENVERVFYAPGNAGTAIGDTFRNLPKLGPGTTDAIAEFAVGHNALVVIGPEAPLAKGVADHLADYNVSVFGPSQEATKLESSKSFAVDIMRIAGVAHPDSMTKPTLEEALHHVHHTPPEAYVIKEDGLAAGKGVYLPDTVEEAEAIVGRLLSSDETTEILFQKRVHGPEFSAFAVSDGKNFLLLPFAQDHKRLLDGDKGPNTGGMGAYAPIPLQTPELEQKVAEMVERTLGTMKKQDTPFQGLLYLGGMVAAEYDDDPVVIEFNARFGDPETQVVLPLVQANGVDIHELLQSAAKGELTYTGILAHDVGATALTVCLAAADYPDSPRKDDVIYGWDRDYKGITIHHAGTASKQHRLVTAGGRVLYVTARGSTIDEAAARAYAAIGEENAGVYFEGMQYRKDIAHQARSET